MNRPLARPAAVAPAAPPLRLAMAPRRVWRLLLLGFGALALAAAAVWAVALGLPQRLLLAAAVASADAGFAVRQVIVEGDRRQDRLSIYREVLSGGTDAMILLDLPDLAARLARLPWVAEAEVRRIWPDTVKVRLHEREPVAVWQAGGRYRLLDAGGRPLPMLPAAEIAGLPLLVGAGADAAAPGFLRMMARHPELAASLVGAVRVGGRRWDLRMKTGETIALPEDAAAPAALARFAAAHAARPLLGQGFARFDLRIEGQMAVRLTPEARIEAEKRARARLLAPALTPAPEVRT